VGDAVATDERGPVVSNPGQAIMSRVRVALADPERAPDIGRRDLPPRPVRQGLVDLFVERAEDHRVSVHRCAPERVEDTLAEVLGGQDVVVPDQFPWSPPHAVAEATYGASQLDPVPAVASTVTLGIATTGGVVLTHGDGQGRRSLPRISERCICVLRAHQVMPGVPEAIAALDPRWPQVWISGRSSEDIELDRIEGIRGPHDLHVILVEDLH